MRSIRVGIPGDSPWTTGAGACEASKGGRDMNAGDGVCGKRGVQRGWSEARSVIGSQQQKSILTEKDELDLDSLDWVLRHGGVGGMGRWCRWWVIELVDVGRDDGLEGVGGGVKLGRKVESVGAGWSLGGVQSVSWVVGSEQQVDCVQE